VSNDLKRHRTLEDLFQSITAAVAKSLGYQRVVLSTYERERNVFVARSHFGAEEGWNVLRSRDVPAEEITRWWTERHRVSKSFHVRDRRAGDGEAKLAKAQEPPRVLAAGEDAWRAEELIWIPLYSDDRLLGCLSVDDPRDGRSPSAETIQALEIFANQAVVAIENAALAQHQAMATATNAISTQAIALYSGLSTGQQAIVVAAALARYQNAAQRHGGAAASRTL